MVEIREIERGENIQGYASGVVHGLFEGVLRANGLPYTHEHFAKIAALVDELTLPSEYRDAAIAGAWLHDTAEDIPYIDVFNPFGEEPIKQEGIVYLNDCIKEAGEMGDAISFIVDLMTHRKDQISYQDYFFNIFSFSDTQPLRDLHILTGLLKMADRRMNTSPDESRNVNELGRMYLKMIDEGADSKTLEELYKRTKTIDAFMRKGDMGPDLGLLIETSRNVFRQNQRSFATDNLLQYLPLAEERLLIEVGENNGLFSWGKLRKVLKDTYIDSLRSYPGDFHEIRNMGRNKKAPEIPGYKRILKELREEITLGALDLG
jgi:hypothetical protein